MDSLVCFECGSFGEIHHHHVVPKRLGGTKTVPLCVDCHGLIHNLNFRNHGILTKKGLDDARKRGVKLGSPQNLNKSARDKGQDIIKNNRKNNEDWKKAKMFIKNFKDLHGVINLSEISRQLNDNGYRTRNGCLYSPSIVKRLVEDRDNPIY